MSAGYAAFSTNLNISAKGNIKEYTAEKLGYVTDGLQVLYDGKTGLSKDLSYWPDLSGNNRDGILKNFETIIMDDNGLYFDGIDDYILIDKMNYENVTMQIVLKYSSFTLGNYNYSFCNFDTGGYGFAVDANTGTNTFEINIDGEYLFYFKNGEYVYRDELGNKMNPAEVNKKYFLSGSYDNRSVVLYENAKKYTIDIAGLITPTWSNTYMIIGGNPTGTNLQNNTKRLNGVVYAIRIYDRALTDDEVLQNYNVDKERFNLS